MQYEVLEKFIKGEKIEDLALVIEYLRQQIKNDGNFYHYLMEKYPPKIMLTDQIGHRHFLLAEWMGRLYPCWTTGHSEKNAKVFQNPPIPFAVTLNGQVYAAEGENQYWHYSYFRDCRTLDDFKNRIRELKEKKVFGEYVYGNGGNIEGSTNPAPVQEKIETDADEESEFKSSTMIETVSETLSLF